jgi:hypothetical protein
MVRVGKGGKSLIVFKKNIPREILSLFVGYQMIMKQRAFQKLPLFSHCFRLIFAG